MTPLPPSPFCIEPEEASLGLIATAAIPIPGPAAVVVNSESALAPVMAADLAAAPDLTDPPVAAAINSPITLEQFEDLNRRAT